MSGNIKRGIKRGIKSGIKSGTFSKVTLFVSCQSSHHYDLELSSYAICQIQSIIACPHSSSIIYRPSPTIYQRLTLCITTLPFVSLDVDGDIDIEEVDGAEAGLDKVDECEKK
jgi:hypothetical protein